MKQVVIFTILLLFVLRGNAQEGKGKATQDIAKFSTFKATKVINAPSPETHYKRDLNFLVSHRFGDIAGDAGGYHNMFGLDNARDIRIGFEYGLTAKWDIGISRCKGSGPVNEIWEGYTKYQVFRQAKKQGPPLTLTYYGAASATTMEASSEPSSPTAFRDFDQRLAYTHQLILGRRFGDRLSLALSPTFVHRNFVAHSDENNIYAMGATGVFKVSKTVGIMAEYFFQYPRERELGNATFYDPLGVGVEIETGGHIFQLTLNNASGLSPTQFIPYTSSQWSEGAFRFGFTIHRLFRM